MGLATFHQAAIRELKRILPDHKLETLGLDHDLFNSFHDLRKVQYTRALEIKADELKGRPMFDGIEIDGELRVIYSRYDFVAGWNEVDYPLIRGYSKASSQKLGVNLIMYVMTN